MASLLDLYMARQNPLAQSLLSGGGGGQPSPAPPAPSGPQVGGLFGGAPRPPQAMPQAGLLAAGAGNPGPRNPGPQTPMQARQAQQAAQREEMARMAPLRTVMSQAGRAVAPDQRLDTRETLVNTGLALLAGEGQVSLGRAIATGVMAGRQAAAKNNATRAKEAAAQQRANQYLSVLGDGPLTPARLEQAIKVATINGDNDALRVFADLRKNLPDDADLLERENITLENGQVAFVNANGEVYNADNERVSVSDLEEIHEAEKDMGWELQSFGDLRVRTSKETGLVKEIGSGRIVSPDEIRRAIISARPADTQLRTRVLEDGTEVEAVWNNRTNSFIPGTEIIVSHPEQGENTSELASMLRSNVNSMRSILGDNPDTEEFEGADAFRKIAGPFGYVSRFTPDSMKGDTAQSFSIYAQDSLSLILQQRSGATVSDAERERLEAVVLPKPGDTAEAVRRKIGKLEEIIAIYEEGGGNAANNALRATVGLPPLPGTSTGNSVADTVVGGLDAMGR